MMWTLKKIINKVRRDKRGFTIAEMVVVSGIFAVLTAVIIFKYGDFNSNILITNMAYEVAITTRQAQIFGLSARGFEQSDAAGGFEFPYGIFFNLNDGSTGATEETKNFILFVDRSEPGSRGYGQCNPNASGFTGGGECDCTGENDECIEQLTMTQGVKISELRVNEGAGCNSSYIDRVAVTFKRPSPEARIDDQGTDDIDDFSFLQVKVEGSRGTAKPAYVLIRDTGQVSVSQDDYCD